MTAVTNETQTVLPTRTLVTGHESGKTLAVLPEYRPANPGDIIELSPPLEPGTVADVISSRVSDEGDDGKPLLVLEVAGLRTR